jgi:type 1 glutamine amidotransferase
VLWVGGFAHEFDEMARIMSEDLGKRLQVELTVVKDGAFLDAPGVKPDVIIMNHCFEGPEGVLTEAQQAKLLEAVKGGGGVVGVHASYYSFVKWDAFRELFGARFTQHGSSDVRIAVWMVDRKHPITRPLAAGFEVTSELYESTPLAKDCRLLAVAREEGKEREWPSVWTRMHGKGRVVAILPAHFPEAYRNEEFQKLIANSVLWAARRAVKTAPAKETDHDR